jgi:dTDP-4-dehydrorhamnose reductase
MSPTYTVDVARALGSWIRQGVEGIVHGANRGSATWFEFGKKALELAGIEVPVHPISHHQYPSRAARPVNSALVSGRRDIEPCVLRPWEEALADYLSEAGWLAAGKAGNLSSGLKSRR